MTKYRKASTAISMMLLLFAAPCVLSEENPYGPTAPDIDGDGIPDPWLSYCKRKGACNDNTYTPPSTSNPRKYEECMDQLVRGNPYSGLAAQGAVICSRYR